MPLGAKTLLKMVKPHLAQKAANRKVTETADKHALLEQSARYKLASGAENIGLRRDNRLLWDDLYLESMSYPGPTRL